MKHLVSNAYNEMVLSQNNAICHLQVDSDKLNVIHNLIVVWDQWLMKFERLRKFLKDAKNLLMNLID